MRRGIKHLCSGLAVFAVAACGSSGNQGDEALPTPINAAEMERPLDAHLPDKKKIETLDKAVTLLANDCLRKFGVNTVSTVRAAPILELINRSVNKYGFIEEAVATRWGYHSPVKPPAQSGSGQEEVGIGSSRDPVEVNILQGTSSQYNGQQVPEGGCRGEALRKLNGDAKWPEGIAKDNEGEEVINFVLKLRSESSERALKEQSYIDMIDNWSSCMKESGYSFKGRDQAVNDTRWQTAAPSEEEIKVAVTDSRCMTRVNYLGIYGSLLKKTDTAVIEKHSLQLTAIKNLWETRLRKAAQTIEGS